MALLDELFGNVRAGASNLVQNASVVSRDIGKSVSDFTKPDGTAADFVGRATSIVRGAAEVITGLTDPKALDNIVNKQSTSIRKEDGKSATKGGVNLTNVVPNPLENFASYAPLWTMAVLTPQQFNKPALYRQKALILLAT